MKQWWKICLRAWAQRPCWSGCRLLFLLFSGCAGLTGTRMAAEGQTPLLSVARAVTEDSNGVAYVSVQWIVPASNAVALMASSNLVDWMAFDSGTNFDAEPITNCFVYLVTDWEATNAVPMGFFKAVTDFSIQTPPPEPASTNVIFTLNSDLSTQH